MDKNIDTKTRLAEIKDLIAIETKKIADARFAINQAKVDISVLLDERKALKDAKRAAAKDAFEAYKKGVAERKAAREAKKAERAKADAEKKAKAKKVVIRKSLPVPSAAEVVARGEAAIAKAKKAAARKTAAKKETAVPAEQPAK